MVNFILPLRVVQAVFAVIILGLTGFIVDATVGFFDSANFMLFCSIWTILVLAYLVATPMFMPSLHNRWAVLGVEAVTMIFWFAAFIALAVDTSPLRGCSSTNAHVCSVPSSMRAATVFGSFEWAAWAASLGLVIHALVQYRKGAAEEHMAASEAGINPMGGLTPTKSDIEAGGGGQPENNVHAREMSEGSPQLSELPARTGDGEVAGGAHEGDGGLAMPQAEHFGGHEK